MRSIRDTVRWLPALAGGLLLLGASARAEDPPPWHPWRLREWPGRLYEGPGSRPHTFERAGYPTEVSRFAYPSETPNYQGYYVGGGVTKRGTELGGRGPQALGTWGWDYSGIGCLVRPLIVLKWNPARYHSGYGRYKIDGPPVTDVGPYVEQLKEGPAAFHKGKGE
jgi:hypothetical protein